MRERLVGALVLVAIVVLFVPALLRGPARKPEVEPAAPQSFEIPVRPTAEPVPEDALVPQPAVPPDGPSQVAAEPAARAQTGPAVEPAPEPVAEPARAEATVAATPDSVGVAPAPLAWAVQLGAFSSREKAESLVADLRKRGYAAFVLEYRANGKVLHRVRVGPEQDRERAAAIAGRLRSDGFQPVVAPHP